MYGCDFTLNSLSTDETSVEKVKSETPVLINERKVRVLLNFKIFQRLISYNWLFFNNFFFYKLSFALQLGILICAI